MLPTGHPPWEVQVCRGERDVVRRTAPEVDARRRDRSTNVWADLQNPERTAAWLRSELRAAAA